MFSGVSYSMSSLEDSSSRQLSSQRWCPIYYGQMICSGETVSVYSLDLFDAEGTRRVPFHFCMGRVYIITLRKRYAPIIDFCL